MKNKLFRCLKCDRHVIGTLDDGCPYCTIETLRAQAKELANRVIADHSEVAGTYEDAEGFVHLDVTPCKCDYCDIAREVLR